MELKTNLVRYLAEIIARLHVHQTPKLSPAAAIFSNITVLPYEKADDAPPLTTCHNKPVQNEWHRDDLDLPEILRDGEKEITPNIRSQHVTPPVTTAQPPHPPSVSTAGMQCENNSVSVPITSTPQQVGAIPIPISSPKFPQPTPALSKKAF